MGAKDNWFDAVASVLDRDTLGVKLGLYGLSLAGCCYAVRRVRPFSKFKSPRDIPKRFFVDKIRLKGRVVGLRFLPDATLLLVDHRPVLLARFKSPGALPLAIEGINVTSNGVCWLQTIVKDDEIDFELVDRREEAVGCIVYHNNSDVAHRLLSLGFATVSPFNSSFHGDQAYVNYYEHLLKSESIAERRQMGIWWDEKPRGLLIAFFVKRLRKLVSSSTSSLSLLRGTYTSRSSFPAPTPPPTVSALRPTATNN